MAVTRRRRRRDLVVLGSGAAAIAAVGALSTVLGAPEQIERYWAVAVVAPDGAAAVTEVIDYDFGAVNERRGIFRDVRGVPRGGAISVSSPTAPDDLLVTQQPNGDTRMRIGNPSRTIRGRHRYRIDYPLPGLGRGRMIDWDTLGTGWAVPVRVVEVHVLSPYAIEQAACFEGGVGSTARCEISEVSSGHLRARARRLGAHQGVSVEVTVGDPLEQAPTPPALPARPPGRGRGWRDVAAILGPLALAGAAPVSFSIRRAGLERVGVGGAVDAAHTGQGPTPHRLVDHAELARLATIEFAPPGDLTPAQGGVVLREAVRDEHKVAWLISAATDGRLEVIEDGKLVRLEARDLGEDEVGAVLRTAFAGRSQIVLGRYDPSFAAAWARVGSLLVTWRRRSGLWDPRAPGRMLATRVAGAVALTPALVAVIGGSVLAMRWDPRWLAAAAMGAVVAGGSLAAIARAWELQVRTPSGAAAYLRTESFRRFLAGSETRHAEEAAARGVLREYTAWAVAVGEIRRWSRAVERSATLRETASAADLGYVHLAPALVSATSSAASEPSSSGGSGGGGGGGGGSVGGGGGGGGGGSW